MNRVMRILLVNNYWYYRGGAERALFETKKLLEDAGHTVATFGMKHPKNIVDQRHFAEPVIFEDGGIINTIVSAIRFVYNANARDRFRDVVDAFRPDVIHVHNIYHHLSFSLLDVARERRIPVVMTAHDYKLVNPNYNLFANGKIVTAGSNGRFYETLLHNTMGSWSKSLLAMVEAYVRAWRYADVPLQIIAPSQFMADKLVQSGYAAERISVIPNPLSVPTAPVTAPDEGYVLYIGRLSPEKGVMTLVQAAKRLSGVRFLFVGGGPVVAEIKEAMRRDHITNIGLVGEVASDMVEHFLASARAVVVPSEWYENYPYAILEAKAAGKVVIGTRIGGIPELLPEDELVAPGNAEALAERILAWYNQAPDERLARGQALADEVRVANNPERYLYALLTAYRASISV